MTCSSIRWSIQPPVKLLSLLPERSIPAGGKHVAGGRCHVLDIARSHRRDAKGCSRGMWALWIREAGGRRFEG